MELKHMGRKELCRTKLFRSETEVYTFETKNLWTKYMDIFTLALIMSQHTPPRQEVKMTALT